MKLFNRILNSLYFIDLHLYDQVTCTEKMWKNPLDEEILEHQRSCRRRGGIKITDNILKEQIDTLCIFSAAAAALT